MLQFELVGDLIHVHGGKIDMVFPNGTDFATAQANAKEWALFAWSDPVKEQK
jgi:hypothetical protein